MDEVMNKMADVRAIYLRSVHALRESFLSVCLRSVWDVWPCADDGDPTTEA